MELKRRDILKAILIAGVPAGLAKSVVLNAEPGGSAPDSPINIILPPDYAPPSDNTSRGYSFKLTRATLDFLESNFSNYNLPIWQQLIVQMR